MLMKTMRILKGLLIWDFIKIMAILLDMVHLNWYRVFFACRWLMCSYKVFTSVTF